MAVLGAFGQTPRHLFVPEAVRHMSYHDAALPLGNGQTISQPSTQARYLSALELDGSERVLEVGTGSGYQAALLSHLSTQVISIERIPELAARARAALDEAGVQGVSVLVGDGSLGWRPYAPFDAIIVGAASPKVPEPLLNQLSEFGRMLIPVQDDRRQQLLLHIIKRGDQITTAELGQANFVPLVGKYGFSSAP